MAISYNQMLSRSNHEMCPHWYVDVLALAPEPSSDRKSQAKRAANELAVQIFQQLPARVVQFVRDGLRSILKVPFRSLCTPIFLSKNWAELERSKVNTKLTGYSFVQLLFVPVKFCVALAALATSAISWKKAQSMLDWNTKWTAHFDGCASRLEALKEEGCKTFGKEGKQNEYNLYKVWLYNIPAELCRR